MKLRDVCRIAGGYAFPLRHQGLAGTIPFFKVSDMNRRGNEVWLSESENYVTPSVVEELRARTFPRGTVVFPKVGASLLTNKRRILSREALFDNNVMGLVPETVLPEFLLKFMATVDFASMVQPGAVPSINGSMVGDIDFPLPPEEEQRRIVEVLSSVDLAIDRTQAVAERSDELRRGLISTLPFRGVPGRHTQFRRLGLITVPRDWPDEPFGRLVEQISDPVEVRGDSYYRELGVRSHGKGLFHKEPVLGAALGAKRVYQVAQNCILFNIVFAWEGAVALTTAAEAGMIASHRFPMFRPRRGVDPHFLRFFFQSPQGTQLLKSISPGGAGRNKTLNQSALLATPVPVPAEDEQRQIVSTLRSVEEAVAAQAASLQQLRLLRDALIKELFPAGGSGLGAAA